MISPVHGSLQRRLLDWVAVPFSRGSSWPRDRTHVSYVSCFGRQVLHRCATWEAHLCGSPKNYSFIYFMFIPIWILYIYIRTMDTWYTHTYNFYSFFENWIFYLYQVNGSITSNLSIQLCLIITELWAHMHATEMHLLLLASIGMGFSNGSAGKESTCSEGETRDTGLIPESGRSPGGRYATHSSILPWKTHGQRSLVATIQKGHKESDISEQLSTAHSIYMVNYSELEDYFVVVVGECCLLLLKW